MTTAYRKVYDYSPNDGLLIAKRVPVAYAFTVDEDVSFVTTTDLDVAFAALLEHFVSWLKKHRPKYRYHNGGRKDAIVTPIVVAVDRLDSSYHVGVVVKALGGTDVESIFEVMFREGGGAKLGEVVIYDANLSLVGNVLTDRGYAPYSQADDGRQTLYQRFDKCMSEFFGKR